ncbi:MAG: MraY family glycosyltransferase [Candidatus Acidiferrales bacterium]
MNYLIPFLTSLLLSATFTRFVRNYAIARGWVDQPDSHRHLHSNPVPRLGGIAICLSFMVVVGASLIWFRLVGFPFSFPVWALVGILGSALMIFLTGLYDDLHSLGAYWKFGMQTLAAVLLYLGGFGIQRIDLIFSGHGLRAAVGLPLTILWVLLITNAFNLLDGLDGLAAGSAVFSTLVLFATSLALESPAVSFLAVVLAGAILGFLRFNFHPASIFLGDSGSLFIGFMLSALALLGSQKAPTMVAVAIPVVSFGLPILDVVIAVLRRFIGAKPLFSGDDDHIHHKLLKRGLSHREAVLILYSVSAGFALLSLALLHGQRTIAIVLAVIGVGVCLGVQYLHYVEFSELQYLARLARKHRQIIANNLNIRRATESLSSCGDFRMICQTLEDSLQPLGFDGIELANVYTGGLPEALFAPLSRTSGGSLRHSWSENPVFEPAWELRLELSPGSGAKHGYFSLLRSYAEDLLLVDLNLLSLGFRAALSDAIDRAMIRSLAAQREMEHAAAPPLVKATSTSSAH